MKTPTIPLLLTVLLSVATHVPALAQTQTADQARSTAYVSDLLDVPLRAGASNRYKIVGAVRSGTAVEVLKVDTVKGYTQIRTPTGGKGWLPSAQIADTPSSREQLADVRRNLEQLQNRNADLKQHLDEVVGKPGEEDLSYPRLYEEALRLRQQLAQYRKVSADTVAIDERNKMLQEQTVALERELQLVQQENRALRDDNDNLRFLMGAVLLGAGLLLAVMMPRIREQRREQWSRL
ncbi:MAG: TIGR04211 family SH3 domain-containing protein [Candidatus Competibacter sp.]|nr:TIGR04211 family SH3 domain-containing protein [Candidatus Competibacter sp.]MDG4584858.1 TIGR04211 family SH3 domain-containing protein [Candidatus Competibacter sp.]